MKYLGKPEATLVTIWVIARHLEYFGPTSASELARVLRPKTLTTGEGVALVSSVEVAGHLEIFANTADATAVLSNAPCLKASSGWFDSFEGFTTVVRRQLMLQAELEPAERSDVATALTWLASRDWRIGSNPLQDLVRPSKGSVVTDTQATAFRRWCVELGYTVTGLSKGNEVRPDPMPALRQTLKLLSGERFDAKSFVKCLSDYMVTGPAHPLALGSTGNDGGSELLLFNSIGYALRRLQAQGVVRLEMDDDALEDQRLLYPFPGPTDDLIAASHVEVAS